MEEKATHYVRVALLLLWGVLIGLGYIFFFVVTNFTAGRINPYIGPVFGISIGILVVTFIYGRKSKSKNSTIISLTVLTLALVAVYFTSVYFDLPISKGAL